MFTIESLYIITKEGKKLYCKHTKEVVVEEGTQPDEETAPLFKGWVAPPIEDGLEEIIKYALDPLSLKDGGGEYDAETVIEGAITLRNKRLYGTFGEFYGPKSRKNGYAPYLNIAENPPLELDEMTFVEQLYHDDEVMLHKLANESAPPLEDGQFFIADLGRAVVDSKGHLRLPEDARPLPRGISRREAMQHLSARFTEKALTVPFAPPKTIDTSEAHALAVAAAMPKPTAWQVESFWKPLKSRWEGVQDAPPF
jgi:hypothetical protein